MGDGLSLNIEKLGHELEEIRVRALESIISKLNLGVLNTEILLDHPDLFFNLINWFNQRTVPCRATVLNLILRLCKTEKDVINQFLRYDPGFKIIRSSVRYDEKTIFKELCDLAEITFPEICSDREDVPENNKNISDEMKLDTTSEEQQYDFTYDSLDKPTILSSFNNCVSKSQTKSEKSKSTELSGQVLWPALQLDYADHSVLNTVYTSLRDPSQSAQAVYFFTTVVLHDFPPQVFLHNTAILSALIDLHASDSCDEYVLQCFRSLTRSLIKYFNYIIDPAVISANVTKAAPEILTDDIGASGDSVLIHAAVSPINALNHSIVGPLSVEDYCGLLLERLGTKVPEVLELLSLCILDFNSFWNDSNIRNNFLKASISSALVKLARTLGNAKSIDAISRLEAQLSVYKILKALIPLEVSMTVVPRELQEILMGTLLESILYLLFPDVHKLFLAYVETFKYQKETEYRDYEEVGKSLEAGAYFQNHSRELNLDDVLKIFKSSVIGLEFHQQYRIIPVFIDMITSKYELEVSQLEAAQQIIVILLSSSDIHIKSSTYESCCEAVSEYLGPDKCLTKDDPLSRLSFIINTKVLTEIVSFGLTSIDPQICKWAETILTLILKCQMLLIAHSWTRLVGELSPVLPLLQAFSSQHSVLGRTIISTLDPDMAKILHLNDMQVLTGNLRLLFSKDVASYEEAKIRLMYILDLPTKLCVLNNPFNFSEDTLQSSKSNPPCNYPEESLLRVLEVISSCPDNDRALIKSALTQLSLIMEDYSLHIVFLDNHGLDLVNKLLFSSVEDLEEDSVQFYSPLISVLKNLARYNIQLRHDFAINYKLYCCILKGLFIFNTEWRIQRDVAQLLALMAYTDVILTTIDTVSFPDVLIARIRIPFELVSHAKVSQYTLPSKRSRLQQNKTVMKSLALRWSIAQYKGGIQEAITKELKDLPQAPFLVVSLQSFRDLIESHISHNLRGLLQSLAMANSHKSATEAIFSLNRYLNIKEMNHCEEELNNLPWESSFLRYLTTLPASVPDQTLLVGIIRCLISVLECLPFQNKWISSLLKDPSSVLCTLLTQILIADSTPLDKELSVEILTLIETCMRRTTDKCWDHTLKILVQCLSQSHTHKFYSLAIMDKMLTCLLKMTSMKLVFNPKPLWLLMNAFHCSSPNSYMGITITRLSLLCLCNLLALKTKNQTKDWQAAECKWLDKLLASRDLIVKSAALELISGLCFDSSSTNALISLLPTLWQTSLSILLDHNEASLAREQAAIVCSNIIITSQNKSYVKNCNEVGLFGCLAIIAARFDFHPSRRHNAFFQDCSLSTNATVSSSDDGTIVSSIATPGLLTACCNLVLNLMVKEKNEVASFACSQGFILELFRQVNKWQSCKAVYSQEMVDMYRSVGKLLVQFTDQTSAAIKDCIPVLVWLLQDSTYTKNVDRTRLTIQIIHLIASIVNYQDDVKVIFTKEAMESIRFVIKETPTSLDLETAVSVTHLAPYLTSDVNIELIRSLRGNGLAERILLAGVLGTSHAATQVALEEGFLEPLVTRLKETYVELAVIPPDIPRNKKANSVLYNLWVDVNLLTNFLAGCVEAKEKCAQLGLADGVHKIWAWCLLDVALLCSLLQALINFTADSVLAASTLVLTSTMAGVGQRKCPTSNSLLHAVIALHSKDIYGPEVKKLLLELMVHACQAQECRVVMNKSNMLNEFLKLQQQKKSSILEEIEMAWLEFLEVYSNFIEGQTTIMKHEDVLDYIISFLSGHKQLSRMSAISVIRNLVFNQTNKQKFIVADKLLQTLSDLLLDESIMERELQDIALITWYLVANSHRGKNAVKAVGLVSRLKFTISKDSNINLMPLFNQIMEIFK